MMEDLLTLSDWFTANKLTLNLSKTVLMVFSPKGKQKVSLVVNNVVIPQVSETKFLGVWLDDKMSWNTHLGKLESKLKRNLGLLRRSKNLLPVSAKRIVYYSHIYSHLTYCILLWGSNLPNATLHRLQSIQNRCMKELKSGDYDTTYKSLEILKVREIIELEKRKFGYKYMKQLLPSKIIEIVNDDQF